MQSDIEWRSILIITLLMSVQEINTVSKRKTCRNRLAIKLNKQVSKKAYEFYPYTYYSIKVK